MEQFDTWPSDVPVSYGRSSRPERSAFYNQIMNGKVWKVKNTDFPGRDIPKDTSVMKDLLRAAAIHRKYPLTLITISKTELWVGPQK